jgi:hypothetical protein
MKHESYSLKSLITNDHLSQLWNLERFGIFECVLEWIASSCIECVWVECLDLLNGGGWGCIYSHQPLPSYCSFSVDRGRSAPVHQRLKSQRSAVTTIMYLMCRQMSDKAVVDGPAVHTRRSTRMLKMYFAEPVTFEFSGFSTTGRSAPEAGRSSLGPRRWSLLLRIVRSINSCFCSVPIRGSP